MTESEWLASTDPAKMLEWLLTGACGGGGTQRHPSVSDRRLRLFACAAWRHYFGTHRDGDRVEVAPESRLRAEQAERHADDPIGWPMPDERFWWIFQPKAWDAAADAISLSGPADGSDRRLAALLREIVGNPFRPSVVLPRDVGVVLKYGASNYRQEDVILQDWLTPLVLSLAHAAYEERLPDGTLDPLTLAALADALLDAGCDNEEILRHLRRPVWTCRYCDSTGNKAPRVPTDDTCPNCLIPHGVSFTPHVRGCWATDLILGLE